MRSSLDFLILEDLERLHINNQFKRSSLHRFPECNRENEIINLNLSPKYCSDTKAWNLQACIREFVQNWRDQVVEIATKHESSKRMTNSEIETFRVINNHHSNRLLYVALSNSDISCGYIVETWRENDHILVLANFDTQLPDDCLILGNSGKKNNGRFAGSYGEGMKVAINYLIAHDFKVNIITKRQIWSFYYQNESLQVQKHNIQNCTLDVNHTTYVIVSKTNEKLLDESLYLFLHETYVGKVIDCSPGFRVLLEERFLGKVFVKGIFVEDKSNSKSEAFNFGIDIFVSNSDVLSRDRNFVEIEVISDLILESFENSIQSEALAKILYKEFKSDSSNGNSLLAALSKCYSGHLFSREIYFSFVRDHGGQDLLNRFKEDRDIPVILPIKNDCSVVQIEEYQYFLDLPLENIVKCSNLLINVLEKYKPRKSIVDYMRKFWSQLLALPDRKLTDFNKILYQWIETTITRLFKGALTIDNFIFKEFPKRSNKFIGNSAMIRNIHGIPEYNGKSFAIVVDCTLLFSSCHCEHKNWINCQNDCLRSAFFDGLNYLMNSDKESMKWRNTFNQQLQRFYLSESTPQVESSNQVLFRSSNGVLPPQTFEFPSEKSSSPYSHRFIPQIFPSVVDPVSILDSLKNEKTQPFPNDFQAFAELPELSVDYMDQCNFHENLRYFDSFNNHRVYVGPSIKEPQAYKNHVEHLWIVLEYIYLRLGLTHYRHKFSAIFISQDTSLVAFNYNGLIMFNAAACMLTMEKPTAISYWFVVLCHELAHNKIPYHGKDHASLTESLIQRLLPVVVG